MNLNNEKIEEILDKINLLTNLIIKNNDWQRYAKEESVKLFNSKISKKILLINTAKLYKDNNKDDSLIVGTDFDSLTETQRIHQYMLECFNDYYVLGTKRDMILYEYPRKIKKDDLIILNKIYKKYKKYIK